MCVSPNGRITPHLNLIKYQWVMHAVSGATSVFRAKQVKFR